jgi:hypothetical protein
MPEPRTIREINASFTVFQTMVWTIIGFLGALLIGAAAIYFQIGDLKTDLAVVKTGTSNIVERLIAFDGRLTALDSRVAGLDGRLATVDKNLQEMRADDRLLRAINRVESQGSPKTDPVVGGFYVTAYEATLIMQFLRPPTRADKLGNLSVGSQVDEARLHPLPEDLVRKAPRLKGIRYAIDDDNYSIALAAPNTDVVFVIL